MPVLTGRGGRRWSPGRPALVGAALATAVLSTSAGLPAATAGSPTSDQVGVGAAVTLLGGLPEIFYFDLTENSLRHAWYGGSDWGFETLDGTGSSWPGQTDDQLLQFVTTTVYDGDLQVFYYDGTSHALRHAWWDGRSWHFEVLDGTGSSWAGAVTDPVGEYPASTVYAGQLHVWYLDTATGGLRHAWWDGQTWHFEVLDGPGSGWPGHSGDSVGAYPAVTSFAGQLQLWYQDESTAGLRHAWWDGQTWHFEVLDGPGSVGAGRTADDIGGYTSVILYGGLPHVFYYDAVAGTLRHAWWTGRAWAFEVLDGQGAGWPAASSDNVGGFTSTVGYGGLPQVFYYDWSVQALRHAWWTGQEWRFETLDGPGSAWPGHSADSVGEYSAALGYDGLPQVYYYDQTAGTLREAWWTGSTWGFAALDG